MRRRRRYVQMVFQDPYGSLDPRMTVGDLIAMAEGVQEIGDAEAVRLIRNGAVVASGLDPTLLVGPNLHSGDQIYVPERGWLDRNLNFVVGTAASISVAMIYRGFFNN